MTSGGDLDDITPVDGILGPGDPIKGGYGDNIYYGAGGGLATPDNLLPDLGYPDPIPPGTPPTPYPGPLPPANDPGATSPLYTDPYGYGRQRIDKSAAAKVIGPAYSLDNFGDDLLAMTSTDRRLLVWTPGPIGATRAAEIVTTDLTHPAPKGRFFVVTPERHVMIFWDSLKFNQFAWCAQENIKDWTYTDQTNSAGFYEMEPAAPFVSAVVTRYGVLAFTVTAAYFITYQGSPYFYTYDFLGHYNAPVSYGSLTALANTAIWYASDGFWQFDGTRVSPLDCPLLDFIQRRIDPAFLYRRTISVYIGTQSECWIFFTSRGKVENDFYVVYNFDEQWWSMGFLGRTCGTPGSALTYPIMSDGDYLYYHEKGRFYGQTDVLLPYAQTGAINMANGAYQVTARQGIVDTRAPAEDVLFYITAKRDRISDGTTVIDTESNLAIRREGGKLDFRATGRDLILRIQSARNGSEPWTFGQFLTKVFKRGQR
jgi:hypothetical protein